MDDTMQTIKRLTFAVRAGIVAATQLLSIGGGQNDAQGAALFTEDFDAIKGGGNGSQYQTGLPLKHSAELPGWTKAGLNCIHAVQRTRGNWALQLVGAEGRDNVLTLDASFAANVKGKTYAVSFDVGPSVWAGGEIGRAHV